MTVEQKPNHAFARSLSNAELGGDFWAVDEALYRLEAPFYRACAGGPYFERTPEWERERERLTELWYSLCPYKVKAAPKKTWMDKLKAWLSPNV